MNAELQQKLAQRRRWEDGANGNGAMAHAESAGGSQTDAAKSTKPPVAPRPQSRSQGLRTPQRTPPTRTASSVPAGSTRSLTSDKSSGSSSATTSSSGSRPAPPVPSSRGSLQRSPSSKRHSASRPPPPVPSPRLQTLGSTRELSGAKFLPTPGRKPEKGPDRPPPPRRRPKDPSLRAGTVEREDSDTFTPDSLPSDGASMPKRPPVPQRTKYGGHVSHASPALTKLSSPSHVGHTQSFAHREHPREKPKSRPNSANYQRPPLSHPAPPPVPNRGVASSDGKSENGGVRRSLSNRSSRPPAPTMSASAGSRRSLERTSSQERQRRNRSQSPNRVPSPERTRSAAEASKAARQNANHDGNSSQISQEERHQLAEQGKSIFQRTMSADHSAPGNFGRNPIEEDDAQTSASSEGEDPAAAEDDEERARQEKLHELRKSYKYARVLDPFDPWEQGYASESDEQSIYLKVEYDDVIEISQRGDNGWWEGSIFDQSRGRSVGEPGKFPADFVQPVPDPYWMEGDDELEAAESSGLGVGSEENQSGAEAASEAAKVMHKRWRNANRLFLALLELVTNEFKYVLSLQICYEVYIEGILDAFGEEYVGSLFPSWQRIWQCHEDILHGLADASRPTWKRLLRFPDKNSPRSASGSNKREHNRRQSVGAPMGNLKNNTSEMRTLAEELDAIQAWHDENVLEDEASLSEDDLQHFLKLLGDWSVQVCHALKTMAGKLKMSSVYIRNYNDALRLYDIWTRQVKGFPEKIYELEQNPKANKLNLSSYLIKPVQHVCRYPLLVREVHKYAADDASKDAVLQCQERLIEVTTEVNSLQDDANPSDHSLTLQDLRNGLRYPNEKVNATVDNILRKDTTQLMKFGVVHIVQAGKGLILKALKTGDAGAPYECFLMNSVLLLTERHQNILSKNRFKLRCYVDVKCVGVSGVIESQDSRMFGFSTQTDDDPNPFSGSLMSKPSKWVFRVGSIAERDAWLRNLEQAMYISRGVSSSGSSPKGQGMYGTATAALNAAQSSRTPSVRSIATAPASMVAGIFGQRSQHQQPQQHQQHQHQQQDNGPDNAQYNSMKDRQNTLQNAHPSYLMQLTNEDPILNELKTRLKQKQSKQSMIDELM